MLVAVVLQIFSLSANVDSFISYVLLCTCLFPTQVDDLLYIVDPSQHRSRAVSGASNFEVPDSASVNEQHEDDPLGSQGAESALVLSNTPVAPPNISNHDDGRGPSYSLGVAHAFLDYVPTAKEVFSGNGENSKSLKSVAASSSCGSANLVLVCTNRFDHIDFNNTLYGDRSGWNHAGDRVIRVNGRADFRAGAFMYDDITS